LLDDLAARFIANGWSLKWLHREIMLSAVYRQSSRPRADAAAIDATNQWLWRMNPRRLDAESYRDSLLQAAGLLNLEMYGPSLDLDALDNTRRTVYGRINRGRTSDILRLYDFPNPFQHSPARAMTITPLQELFVLNSPFMKQLSEALAKSMELVRLTASCCGFTPAAFSICSIYPRSLHVGLRRPETMRIQHEETKGTKSLVFLRFLCFFVVNSPRRSLHVGLRRPETMRIHHEETKGTKLFVFLRLLRFFVVDSPRNDYEST
jgi:hypothetical protein